MNVFDLLHRTVVTGLFGASIAGIGVMGLHASGIGARKKERQRLEQEAIASGEYVPPPPKPEPSNDLTARRDPKDLPLNAMGRTIYSLAEEMIQEEAKNDKALS